MKTIFLFLTLCSGLLVYGQTTINGSFVHNGINRTYSFYVPAIYNSSVPVPLVLNLHGYTSNGAQQSMYGNFKPIADTANFIVVHPDGTLDGSSNRFWNVGFAVSTVDDVGFLESLIDTISAHYSIDPSRIYTTGMSNGGYMSYRLMCESNRFAAMASVTGSMTTTNFNSCNPSKPTPVMEIHGTADGTVPYNGGTGSLGITAVLDYWQTFNNCPAPPTMVQVPDNNTSDGATAEHYIWSAGNGGVTMEHFKVINGGHTWPGSAITIGTTCQDFSASKEIWRFFSQYSLPPAGVDEISHEPIRVYPNPTQDIVTIVIPSGSNEQIKLFTMTGQEILSQEVSTSEITIDLSDREPGVYLIRCGLATTRVIKH